MSRSLKPNEEPSQRQKLLNLTLAGVASSVGLLTLVIIIGAVLLGLWLDARYNSKPTYTIVLVIASIPISLAVMFVVVRAAVSRMKTKANAPKSDSQEGTDLGAR